MTHELFLHDEPFQKIKYGTKRIEMRLNDEKRRLIRVGDSIRFTNRTTNETLTVEVTKLVPYKSFKELYAKNDKKLLGYKEEEIADSSYMEQFYPKEKELENGVLAIHIKLI